MSREDEEVDVFLRCCTFHGEFTMGNDLSTVYYYQGSVATVENGVVKGIKVGTATITVTTTDGGKTATCVVTVKEEGSAKGTFTNEGYTEGEPFTWN